MDTCGVCVACRSLVDLKDMFQAFSILASQRAIYPKPADTAYYDFDKAEQFNNLNFGRAA